MATNYKTATEWSVKEFDEVMVVVHCLIIFDWCGDTFYDIDDISLVNRKSTSCTASANIAIHYERNNMATYLKNNMKKISTVRETVNF